MYQAGRHYDHDMQNKKIGRERVDNGVVERPNEIFRDDPGSSAVLYRLLTQTIDAPKKRTVKSDKHIKRKSGKGR